MTIYCKALFARGSGIGTRLFPWARCVIFSNKNNVQMIRPNWVQPRIGPLLRGGIDYTSYHRQILLLGLFNSPKNKLNPFHELMVRNFVKYIDEDVCNINLIDNKNENVVIQFSEDKGRFLNLNGYDEFLRDELNAITKKKWKNFIDSFNEIPIGINIRLGNDFKKPNNLVDHYNTEAVQTPIKWFIESLKAIRIMLGFDAAAYIVSDGTEYQLSDLLVLPNTHFVRPGCAISDLLILSKSKVLLRSGGSSFSAWASYLGQMPTISHPGQSMKEFNMINKFNYFTGEFSPVYYNKKLHQDIINNFRK